MPKIFIIDWALLPAFLSSALTGILLHTADPVAEHAVWHGWAVAHVLTSLLFALGTALHVHSHWGWYKAWLRGKGRKQSPVTRTVTLLFLALLLTGLILLPTEGGGTPLGLWHFRLGLLVTLLCAGHILKRLPLLRRSLKGRAGKGRAN